MGKRRLATAIELYRERHPDAETPAVRWLPFQLNPDLPVEGISRTEYFERKFGSPTHSYARVEAVGRRVGIPFAFDKIRVQPNTVNAHRLLDYADKKDRQDEVAEELFRAYFIEGANLTDLHLLAEVGERGGLERGELAAYLASDAGRDAVAAGDIEARGAGINGVPFFIFNRKVGVSGAQEPETLLQAMLRAVSD